MPITNPFFNLYKNKPEQSLVEDLINESIKMMGFQAYYVPNSNDIARDLLFSDDPLKKFDAAYPLEVYLSNSMDPGISGDFFSKFGLEIKNNISIKMTRRAFAQRVPQDEFTRPREGDLIYVPWLSGTGELYEIKFVNDTADFFTLGRKYPYYWELDLELFKYSHEDMNTGIEEIDFVEKMDAYSIEYSLGSGSGDYIINEIAYQGIDQANSSCHGTVQDWDATNKILRISNILGTFSNSSIIIGATSNARFTLTSYDPLDEPQIENAWDNKVIKNESDPVIDTSEVNPLGFM